MDSIPSPPYYRVFLTISQHPLRPLDGNGISFSGEIPDGLLDMEKVRPVHEEAKDRFDLGEWASDLYVARLYLNEDGDPVGVDWEDTPQVYEHGMGDNPIEEIPDDLTPVDGVSPP